MNNILSRLKQFRDDRDWQKFHTPEALARAIMIESGELNELWLWDKKPGQEKIKEEIADVFIYCLNLCIACDIDPMEVIKAKIDINEKKYPVDKSKGKSDKYTNYTEGNHV